LLPLYFVLFSAFCFAQKEKFLVAKFSFNQANAIDDHKKFKAKVYGGQLTDDSLAILIQLIIYMVIFPVSSILVPAVC